MATDKELKKRMALPPIPQAPTKDKRGGRDRSRVRLEISPEQCRELMELMSVKLRSMDVSSPAFRHLYTTYSNLKIQLDKTGVTSGKN
jgi:hypothetical protein